MIKEGLFSLPELSVEREQVDPKECFLKGLRTDRAIQREPQLAASMLEPLRLRFCWRFVRLLATMRGQVSMGEFLGESLKTADWTGPPPYQITSVNPDMEAAPLSRELVAAQEKGTFIPLTPKNGVHEESFIAALQVAASLLRVEDHDDPWNSYSIRPFLDPERLRDLWPEHSKICMWEQAFAQEVLQILSKQGHQKTVEWIQDKHGLLLGEAVASIRLSKALALRRTESSMEEERALMVLRLEDMINRAKEDTNYAAESQGLKQLATIQGFAKTQPEGPEIMFRKVVRKVSGET